VKAKYSARRSLSEVLSVECDSDLSKVVKVIRRGGVVAYPTDTVYGLGCSIYREDSIRRLIELKRRDLRPLPVLCSSPREAERLVDLGELGRRLALRYWPGGLTIVAEVCSEGIPSILTGGSRMLGVRVPNHRCALNLIGLCGGSLVGTSANISGSPPLGRVEDIIRVFGRGLDVLVYGGEEPSGVQSTVVCVSGGELRILREGVVSSKDIFLTLGRDVV